MTLVPVQQTDLVKLKKRTKWAIGQRDNVRQGTLNGETIRYLNHFGTEYEVHSSGKVVSTIYWYGDDKDTVFIVASTQNPRPGDRLEISTGTQTITEILSDHGGFLYRVRI